MPAEPLPRAPPPHRRRCNGRTADLGRPALHPDRAAGPMTLRSRPPNRGGSSLLPGHRYNVSSTTPAPPDAQPIFAAARSPSRPCRRTSDAKYRPPKRDGASLPPGNRCNVKLHHAGAAGRTAVPGRPALHPDRAAGPMTQRSRPPNRGGASLLPGHRCNVKRHHAGAAATDATAVPGRPPLSIPTLPPGRPLRRGPPPHREGAMGLTAGPGPAPRLFPYFYTCSLIRCKEDYERRVGRS